MAPKKVILSCLISEHTESVSNNRHWFSVRLLSDLSMIVKSDGQIHLLASQVSKQNSQIHLFQSSPQNWKPNPLENPQPREVARALVEAACVVFFLKTAVGNCTLYHRNFPTSKTFRKKTNRLNFPVTKKNTSKRPKITYPPGDFKAMSRNNVIPCFGRLLRFSSPVPTSPLPKNEYEICKFQGFPGESAGIQPCNTLLWDENVKKCWKIA